MDKPVALIVEDDRDIAALFRHVLDVAGYQTEIILDGREAMSRLEVFTPQIVLLDLQLPGISGVEILTRMRADDRLHTVPVVVITAYAPYADSLPVEPDLLLLKPVDITQLSNLVQRLQVTKGALSEPSRDVITGLYTLAFFKIRLAFSLERIKQTEFRKFGVLFAEVDKVNELEKKLSATEFKDFFRKLADQFKVTLRPTDTMAWSPLDDCFLTLIEEIPSPEVPLRIAERVKDSMQKFLSSNDNELDLKPNLGVLLCDSEYENVQKIMDDINKVRLKFREELYTNPSIFDHEMLEN